jgi:hypothetical protein
VGPFAFQSLDLKHQRQPQRLVALFHEGRRMKTGTRHYCRNKRCRTKLPRPVEVLGLERKPKVVVPSLKEYISANYTKEQD